MSDKKIVIVTDRIANIALEQSIVGDKYEVCYLKSLSESEKDHKLKAAIALIVWHEVIDTQFMSKTPNCGIIVRYGAGFDNVIIENAYKAVGMKRPWTPWDDRCYRTIKDMVHITEDEREGSHHNALDDAIHQANHLIKILRS